MLEYLLSKERSLRTSIRLGQNEHYTMYTLIAGKLRKSKIYPPYLQVIDLPVPCIAVRYSKGCVLLGVDGREYQVDRNTNQVTPRNSCPVRVTSYIECIEC